MNRAEIQDARVRLREFSALSKQFILFIDRVLSHPITDRPHGCWADPALSSAPKGSAALGLQRSRVLLPRDKRWQ